MEETNKNETSAIPSAQRYKIKGFLKSHKIILYILVAVLLVATVVVCVKIRSKSVIGNYSIVYYMEDNYRLTLENSYLNVTGIDDSTKKSELYLRFSDNVTGRLEGYVYMLGKYKDYQKYEFHITKQTGTALGDMDYIYFYYYPNRGDNGVIEVNGSNLTLKFIR